jgi:broad specificity phosphatase PhoE
MKGIDEMAATRTRTRKTTKPVAEIDVDLDDLVTEALDNADAVELEEDATDDTPEAAPARKYFSHANCDHARKGDAGKTARAACRRAIRAWLAAKAEFDAEEEAAGRSHDVAV